LLGLGGFALKHYEDVAERKAMNNTNFRTNRTKTSPPDLSPLILQGLCAGKKGRGEGADDGRILEGHLRG
jgi:hypothetical protein